MKKIAWILNTLVIALLLMPSCTDEKDPIYDLKKAPVMNAPTGYYVLNAESRHFIMETFTWMKGDYGFDAGPVYGVEAALDSEFETEIVELTSSNDPFSNVTVGRMNAVLQGWEVEPGVETDLYIRVKATLNLANSVHVYSEPILITVIGFEDAAPNKQLLYIVGNVFDPENEWTNDASKIGTGLIPLFTDINDSKDQSYTYTGYFREGGFKVIVVPGDWGQQYGLKDGALSTDGGDIMVAAAGFYTLKMNTSEMTFSMTPYTAEIATYNQIGMIGAFNDWGGDHVMTPFSFDIHLYKTEIELENDSELKFRANGGWDKNWGNTTFPLGAPGGENIPALKGKYYVQFNAITGHYLFMKK